jgi:hypothetical protein
LLLKNLDLHLSTVDAGSCQARLWLEEETRVDAAFGRDQARYAGTLRSSEPFTSLPSAHDLGGENPYIDTKDVLKLLIVGDSAVRLLVTLGARSAW